jgi:putative glutamine amidotransferase
MICVALTQRVELVAARQERRDALDQRWAAFLDRCGIVPVLVPNNPEILSRLLEGVRIGGVILTGGGDLVEYGGDAPERDRTEQALLKTAIEQAIPLIGICRGMQAIQNYFGVKLAAVAGHVTATQAIVIDGQRETVNSYHDFGARASVPDLEVWAMADDGVIKAVRHRKHRIEGMMWHPERFAPSFRDVDVARFRRFFGVR